MRHAIAWLLLAAGATLVASHSAAVGDDLWPVDLQDAFERASRMDGAAYFQARHYLMQQPEELVKILREKSKSGDWRQRDVVRALLMRIEDSEQVELWDFVLLNRYQELKLLPNGTVRVRLPANSKPVTEKRVPEEGVVLDRRSVPLLLERLREIGPNPGNGYYATRLFTMLHHFADPDSAEAVTDFFFHYQHQNSSLDDLLIKLGEQTAAPLREGVESAPAKYTYIKDGANEDHRERYRKIAMAIRSARLLGRIGDRASIRTMLERLNAAPTGLQALVCAESLAAMNVKAALPRAFDHLVNSTDLAPVETDRASNFDAVYSEFRQMIFHFEKHLRPFLLELIAAEHSPVKRAVALGLLFELDHPDQVKLHYQRLGLAGISREQASHGVSTRTEEDFDIIDDGRNRCWQYYRRTYGTSMTASLVHHPKPILLERCVAFAEAVDLQQVDDLAIEIAELSLLTRKRMNDDTSGARIVLALASAGHQRSMGVFEQLLDPKRTVGYSRSIVEAMLLLGNVRAIPLLESIVQRAEDGEEQLQESAEVAEAVLPVIRNGGRGLAQLLDHDTPSVRLAAARRLASQRNVRSLPVLVKAALETNGNEFDNLFSVILQLGPVAAKPLEERQMTTNDKAETLLCEALVLSIRRPAFVAKMERAATIRAAGFQSKAGPGLNDHRLAGSRVADFTGEDAIPLLETAAIFDAYGMNRGIAAFALADFKQQRSIFAVVRSMRRPVFAHDTAVSVEALKEFGEAGIEAAKSIPPPDPSLANYGGRAVRSRGGARLLIDAGEQQGVETILKAINKVYKFNEEPPGESFNSWHTRTARFLGIAAKLNDERLIEPLLRFARERDSGLSEPGFRALLPYADDRITSAAMSMLTQRHPGGAYALQNLVRLRGMKATRELVAQLDVSTDIYESRSILQAIHELTCDTDYWARNYQDSEAANRLAEVRRIVKTTLIKKLRDKDTAQQSAVAATLATFDPTDCEVVAGLCSWVSQPNSSYLAWHGAVDYLLKSGQDHAAARLLEVYRDSGHRNAYLVVSLGKMKYGPAFQDLCIGLNQQIKQIDPPQWEDGIPEIWAIAETGQHGLNKVHMTLRGDCSLHVRSIAAQALGKHEFKAAFDDVRDLLWELAELELDHTDLVVVAEAGKRKEYLSSTIKRLVYSLARLDRQRALPVFTQALFKFDDLESVRVLGNCAQRVS